MSTIIKLVGRLAALLVAGVLAITALSTAPSSAAPARSNAPLAASTSADTTVAARTLARKAPACWRRHHRCFGSIAVNPKTGRAFFANDRLTKNGAKNLAVRKCHHVATYHQYCRSAGWARNYCLGVAARVPAGTSTIVQWASAGAGTYKKALKKARGKLGGAASVHHNWAWLCTTRKA